MATFIVSAEIVISVFTEVEASSAKEALQIAEGRRVQGLCHQCGGAKKHQVTQEWRTWGELDGEPRKLEVEEA